MKNNKIYTKIILPKITDDCTLIFAENRNHIPFDIKRVFFIQNPKPGLPRGYHAHKRTQLVLFCIQGSVKITCDNRKIRESVTLNHANEGIYIPQMIWHEMHNFKRNTILLVLASEVYDPEDYVRDYHKFRELSTKTKN